MRHVLLPLLAFSLALSPGLASLQAADQLGVVISANGTPSGPGAAQPAPLRPHGDGGPGVHVGFVNSRVSSRSVSLNQHVRVAFTTMPAQIAGVDPAAVVAHALELGSSTADWRLASPAVVQVDPKTRTVTVSFTVLPRMPGPLPLPQLPLSWLGNDEVADFGVVTVSPNLLVGTRTIPLPPEFTGVGGLPWGCSVAQAEVRIIPSAWQHLTDHDIANPTPGLELEFRAGELSGATVEAIGLDLDHARQSFCDRWGIPANDEIDGHGERLTWVIGWVRISATSWIGPNAQGAPASGTRIRIRREDIEAKAYETKVQKQVFHVLDGPAIGVPPPTPAGH